MAAALATGPLADGCLGAGGDGAAVVAGAVVPEPGSAPAVGVVPGGRRAGVAPAAAPPPGRDDGGRPAVGAGVVAEEQHQHGDGRQQRMTMRLIGSFVGRVGVSGGASAGEALEMDVLAGHAGVEGGALGRVHPGRAAAEVDVALVHVGHQVAQPLDVAEVGGVSPGASCAGPARAGRRR